MDQNAANDTLRSTFTISDTTFARDNGIVTGTLGIGANVTGYLGSEYPINAVTSLSSVSIYMTLLNSPAKYGIAVFKSKMAAPACNYTILPNILQEV